MHTGCRKLKTPKHGTMKYLLNIAIFTCDDGYKLKGLPSIACILGKWLHKEPTCEGT